MHDDLGPPFTCSVCGKKRYHGELHPVQECMDEAKKRNYNYSHWEKLKRDMDKKILEVVAPGLGITIYLSGPMTGYPDFNAAEFKKYADKYRTEGYTVISPLEQDRKVGFDKEYTFYLRRDVRILLSDEVNRVYLLPGWHKSKGANLEVHLARIFNIPIYDAETGKLWKETCAEEATRLVYGDRRETYVSPYSDFHRTMGILNALFQDRLTKPFTEEDVSFIMMAVKISRLYGKLDHRDSLVDICGYALCFEWLRNERQERKNNEGLSNIAPSS